MPVYLTGLSQACPDAKLLLNWPLRLCNLSPIPFPFRTKKLTQQHKKEFETQDIGLKNSSSLKDFEFENSDIEDSDIEHSEIEDSEVEDSEVKDS